MNLAQILWSQGISGIFVGENRACTVWSWMTNRNNSCGELGVKWLLSCLDHVFLWQMYQRCIYFLKTEIYRSLVNVCKCYKLLRWIWFSEVKFQKNNKFCTHFLNLTPPKTNVTETTFTNHLGRFVSPSSKVTGDSPAIAMLVFWRFLEGICCLWLFMAVVNLPRPPPFPERTPPRNSRPYDQRLNNHWFPMF